MVQIMGEMSELGSFIYVCKLKKNERDQSPVSASCSVVI